MRAALLLVGLGMLGGCAASGPARPHLDKLEGASLALVYAEIERVYRNENKFRTDYEPADAPVDAAILTRNFIHVAQRSETQTAGKQVLVTGQSIPLTRWERPVTVWTSGMTRRDLEHLDRLSAKVSRLTGLDVTRTTDAAKANVYVIIADADEREQVVALVESMAGGAPAPLLRAWPRLPEFPCIARVFTDPGSDTLGGAIILVKAELSGDFRKSCLTEEFIQAMGLFNDGPDIRPSIFNDDAEFIELTRHDEYLLQILYDRRLAAGMSSSTSTPIVQKIAAELLADAGT